ncbi:MAG: hypothetical protein AB8B56_08300 [Crocinitomicaceae bacterium]
MGTIDSNDKSSKPKELWTVKLLLLSILVTVFTIIISTLDGTLGIPHRYLMFLIPIALIIAFVSSCVGFVVGFNERKKNKRQALFGIIANLVVLIFYIISLIILITMIRSVSPM